MKKTTGDPWEDWMGELKFPVPKTELLDHGLAPLVKLMNIPGKMYTSGSCLHDRFIILYIENEEWFLREVVSRIVISNKNQRYLFHVSKTYDFYDSKDECRQKDKYGNQYYWVIKIWMGEPRCIKKLINIFKQVRELV